MTTEKEVIVITVNHNASSYIDSCLLSILNQTYNNYRVIVADSASTDDSRVKFSSYKHPKLEFHFYNRNVGPIAIWSDIVSNFRTDYVLLLNVATMIPQNFIEVLVRCAERLSLNYKFGGITPLVKRYEDESPYLMVCEGNNFALHIFNMFLSLFGKMAFHIPYKIGSVVEIDSFWGGCCLLNHRMLMDVKFDPLLINYDEEFDLSYRARKKGYRFFFTSLTWAKYQRGVATIKRGVPTGRRLYLSTRNNWYVSVKNSGLPLTFVAAVRCLLITLGRTIKYPSMISQTLRGASDGLILGIRSKYDRHACVDEAG